MMSAAGRLAVVIAVAAVIVPVMLSPAHGARSAAYAAGAPRGVWGSAREVPGTAALNKGGLAQVGSVSCASPGECSAGGFYQDVSGRRQAFVVNEVNGGWRTALEVPGTAVLNKGPGAVITSVSCASPGNCGAGGAYSTSAGVGQALVVNEVDGIWHAAIKVSGIPGLGPVGGAVITSVSCASPGNCSAGGYYQSFHVRDYVHAIVVNEVKGTWHAAIEVPGIAVLNQGVNAQVSSVSCGSPGTCAVGGFYADKARHTHAFVASEVNGTWQPAVEVPGIAALDRGETAQTTSVSCAASGACTAGGYYADSSGRWVPFVTSQVNGTWHAAAVVPGMAGLDQGPTGGGVLAVSCASPGDCSAGGYYQDGGLRFQAFAASQVNGTWHAATPVPGAGPLNAGGNMRAVSVSCPSPGNCGLGGYYVDKSGHFQVFADTEVNGTWGTAIEVPGTSGLNSGGYADMPSVSCAGPGECSAGGNYTDSSHQWQAFLTAPVSSGRRADRP